MRRVNVVCWNMRSMVENGGGLETVRVKSLSDATDRESTHSSHIPPFGWDGFVKVLTAVSKSKVKSYVCVYINAYNQMYILHNYMYT